MASPVTIYRWDDVGAPQVANATPSELLTIIKKCCVDGYGTKSPLGWNILEESNTLLVMQNSIADGGSGSIVQFRASGDEDTAGNIIYFKGAGAFVGVDNLTKPSYQKAIKLRSNWDAWVLIGTATGFYFIYGHPTAALAEGYDRVNDQTIFVGDIKSYIQADAGRFIVLSGGEETDITATNIFSWSYHWDRAVCSYSSIKKTIKLWSYDGASSSIDYYIRPPFCDLNRSSPVLSTCDYFQPFLITENGSSTTTRGQFSMRGEMPGLVSPLCPFQESEAWPSIVEINGFQHFAVRGVGRSVKSYINIEEW